MKIHSHPTPPAKRKPNRRRKTAAQTIAEACMAEPGVTKSVFTKSKGRAHQLRSELKDLDVPARVEKVEPPTVDGETYQVLALVEAAEPVKPKPKARAKPKTRLPAEPTPLAVVMDEFAEASGGAPVEDDIVVIDFNSYRNR